MNKIYTLALGLLVTSGVSYGQKTHVNPTTFPQQTPEQPTHVVQDVEYNQKNFLQSVNSISSGNWNQPGTWDCGCVPTFQDDVNIMPSHVITVNQDINIGSIFIDSTAVLNTTNAGVVEINITGDWINNGDFTPNISEVFLNGYEDQTISGVTVFNKLFILHNRNVDIMSPISITNMLVLEDATLNTNNQLTFAYQNGKTAELYRVQSGTIVGEVIAESSVNLSSSSWFSTASPLSNATINEWNDDIITSGFLGADYPDYPFNNISYFTENTGYVSVTNINDPIYPGTGYFIFENSGVHPYDVQGIPVVGNFSFPITHTDSLPSENRGWNLLGNPYIATINWNNQAGWTKENLGQALYLWDVNAQTYKVYMNGYTVNGGTPIIKPFDNFFITTASNPVLEINENAKQNGEYVTGYPQSNFFKFKVNGESTADEMIIILDADATTNYDISNDAIRTFNNSKTEICTVSEDGQNLSINSLPLIESGFDIPLIINSPTGGTFTLDVLNMPSGLNSCVAIENLITNEIYDLQETSSITFTIDPTNEGEIFMLHIGGSVTGSKIDVSCNGLTNGSITATGSGNGNWDYYWYDQDENLIFSDLEQNESSTLDTLAAGIYTLVIGNLDFCPSLTQTIEVEEPDVLTLEADITQPGCNDPNSGEIISMASGGNQEYSYVWSNGATDYMISNLAEGTYELTVTDMNNCEVSQSYVIDEATEIDASFDIDQITPLEGGLTEVSFTNNSDNANSYYWEFGDGVSGTVVEPTHIYTEPGEYIVTLTVYQGECSMSYNYVLFIEDYTISVDEFSNQESISIINTDGNYSILFNLETSQEVKIMINNLLGQEISVVTTQIQKDYYSLELPQGKNQIFFVTVLTKNDQTRKIFKVIQR